MKRVFNKMALISSLLVSFSTFQAHAGSYICLGADEGYATVTGAPDENGLLKPFGHAQGYELRLLEGSNGMLNLTLKKSGSDIISVGSVGTQGLYFSQGSVSINCVKQQ